MNEQTEANQTADQQWITVGAYPDPATTHVAKSALESAGIPVFIQGENANGLIPVAFFSRVQVRSEDEAAAREVLSGNDLAPMSLEEVTAAEQADEAERA